MGLYNFQARFAPKIEAGEKTHTIRATRKTVEKVGNTMHLYTGLRQKGARLLGRFPCVKVEEIRILEPNGAPAKVFINGAQLEPDEREQLARRDGFQNFSDMIDFWEGRLPFEGHIIHWRFQR